VFDLPAGGAVLELDPGPVPTMAMVIVPLAAEIGADAGAQLAAATERAVLSFSDDERTVRTGGSLHPGDAHWQLALDRTPLRFAISAPGGGRVAVFTEHHPDEFSLRFTALERRLRGSLSVQKIASLRLDEAVVAVQFVQGSRLAAITASGSVWLGEGSVADWQWIGEHSGGGLALAVQPGGALVAWGGLDGTLRLWRAADGTRAATVQTGFVAFTRRTPTSSWRWFLSPPDAAGPPAHPYPR